MMRLAISKEYRYVMDRQTDRQMDRHTAPALSLPCIASCGKNPMICYSHVLNNITASCNSK